MEENVKGQLLQPMWAVNMNKVNYTSSVGFNFETPTYVVAHTSLTSVATFIAGHGDDETLPYWAGAKSGVLVRVRKFSESGLEKTEIDFGSHEYVFGPDTVNLVFYMEATAGECSGVASVYVW